MKPPPRNRTKRQLSCWTETPESRRKAGCKWGRPELKKLLKALQALSQTTRGLQEIDYAVLKKHIPTRSISEISAMVDSLKNKTISSARFQLQMKNWEEKQFRRPIEEWTHMASTLAGTLEKVISDAFSQMLVVSSTEPCTLRNCDPKQDLRPAVGPVPCMPVKGERPSALLLMAPAPARSGSRRLPAPSQAVRGQTRKILPRQKQPAVPSAAAASTSTSLTGCPDPAAPLLSETLPAFVSSGSLKPLAPAASGLSPVSAAAQSAVSLCLPVSSFSSPHSTVPLSHSAAELPATFLQSSKHAAVDDPKTVGVNFAVDFEKLYKFLSVVQNPSEDYNLTPMESAIVLDLLMSLPEELHHLDCKNLQKHLIQMHQSLSAPVCSMPAKQLMSKLQNARRVERGPAPAADRSQEAEAAGAAHRGATSSGQSEDADMADFLPPLNPFLVPLSLLMRKQSSE